MNDWTSGYVAEIGYTHYYYRELNPLRVKLAFLNAGLVAPEFGTACELGFGQGVSVNMHASASICSWHGTDFNPAQAGFAQELAVASGANAHLYDESFIEFAQRDLPSFDFIALHGIWSWISDENRSVIVEFIRKKLKVGGVLYISYNTLPGLSTYAPMRHLMTEHAENLGTKGLGIIGRVEGALEFTEKLFATNPIFINSNPKVLEGFAKTKERDRHYLAHEYFNRDWHPMYFADVAKWLKPAKLTYACSANYLDYVDAINLTQEQKGFLNDVNEPIFRQTVRDFMVNQQFRKDYWVKGARGLTTLEQRTGLNSQRFLLTEHRNDILMKVTGALGEATLNESLYRPILDLMADHKIRDFSQLEQSANGNGLVFSQLIEMIFYLCGNGTFSIVQEEAAILKSKKYTDKLNLHIMLKARTNDEIGWLASPVTGGGMMVNRFHKLFLLAINQGSKRPEELASFVKKILDLNGQKIIKNSITLEGNEEQLLELTNQANEFVVKQLPILKALQIA